MTNRIGLRELNQHASRVIANVKRGQTIEVTERGRPVARIVPIGDGGVILDRLVAEGRAQAPSSSGPIPMPAASGDPNVDAAAAIASARESERW